MKAKCLKVFCILLFTIAIQCRADDRVQLYTHWTQGDFTNVWMVSSATFKKSLWNPDNGEPPISLGKAVELAKKWVVATGSYTNCYLENIEIRVLGGEGSDHICYYNMLFGGTGCFGHHRRCILLIDGTVVEPEWLGRGPKSVEKAYYPE